MKINELKLEQVVVGLRFRSLVNHDRIGRIVKIDKDDDYSVYYQWEDEDETATGCWYGNDCECEVVEESLKPRTE